MMNRNATTPLISCLAAEPSAEALAMTGITTIDVLAAGAPAEGQQPEWIKITPRGPFTARDGRRFDTAPETLVERFAADGVAVPIDIDHATVKKALFGDNAPAVGWIEKLEARPDGTYGQVTWLDEGVRVLSARTHRYISPALKADDQGRAIWLHSAALVAAPAISMPAVASANPATSETPMLKAIAMALGLNAEADDASCLSAIGDLRQRIDPAVHQQTLDTLTATTAELTRLKTAGRKEKIDALLEGALKDKKISPAQRDTYEALCATDDGFAQVTKLIETLGAGLAPSGLDDKKAPGTITTLSAEDREVMKMLGISEEDYRKANGLPAA